MGSAVHCFSDLTGAQLGKQAGMQTTPDSPEPASAEVAELADALA